MDTVQETGGSCANIEMEPTDSKSPAVLPPPEYGVRHETPKRVWLLKDTGRCAAVSYYADVVARIQSRLGFVKATNIQTFDS